VANEERILLDTTTSIKEERDHKRGEEMSMTTEQVWEAFHVPLLQFIRKRVSDEATAEDLLQDVFLKIHQQIGTLKDAKKLESWIYQITRHAIIDLYRSKRPTVSLEEPEVLQLPEELPDDDIVSELFPSVRTMVNSLPEQDRQALVLTEYQGLTQKEFGERLGLSFSGAKSRVQRAREKLKQQLLACCHFELDRRKHIIDYQPRCQCCSTGTCCSQETVIPLSAVTVRPLPRSLDNHSIRHAATLTDGLQTVATTSTLQLIK
jgi:RNA polymerase sigma-70 factor (ECF subfamily)